MRRPQQNRGPIRKEQLHRTNGQITAHQIRVVGEHMLPGVYDSRDALRVAEDLGLDLVEINAGQEPPICRIVDYSKFLYEQRKREKEAKVKAKAVETKEIRFGPNTAENDFNTKLKHAREFIDEGHKVRCFVQFRGRAIVFKEQGEILLLKFAQALETTAKVEALPKLEGKRMFLSLAPKQTKK